MNAMRRMRSKKSNQGGFSLIELAILMAIIGVAVSMSLDVYRQYRIEEQANTTTARKNMTTTALANFVSLNGRFPCPADPALPVTDPNAGKENCINESAHLPVSNLQNCTLCRFYGARDVPGSDPGVETNLQGSIPYATIGLSSQDTIDSWGSKFTYVISELLTDSTTFSENSGSIAFTDYFEGEYTPMESDYGPGGSFLLMVISPGPDRKGGYNRYGLQTVPCEGVGKDIENCNKDTMFMGESRRVTVAGEEFFDDGFVVEDIELNVDYWSFGGGATYIQNKSGGRVGIGTERPGGIFNADGSPVMLDLVDDDGNPYQAQQMDTDVILDVAGNIRADTVNAVQICDEEGNNCFPTTAIGGSLDEALNCGGSAFRGFGDAIEGYKRCSEPKVNLSGAVSGDLMCPADQYLTGITAAGEIVCEEL